MKLHLPKSLRNAVLFCMAAIASQAHADFIWQGDTEGIKTSDDWQTAENWKAEDSTWSGTGSGPGTTNSNMWDTIVLKNVTFGSETSRSVALEGWAVKFKLDSAQLYATMGKYQAIDGSYSKLEVYNNSVLDFKLGSGSFQGSDNTLIIGAGSSITFRDMQNAGSTAAFNVSMTGEGAYLNFIAKEGSTINHTGAITINAYAENVDSSVEWGRFELGLFAQGVTLSSVTVNMEGWKATDIAITEDNYKGYSNCYSIEQDAEGKYWVVYANESSFVAELEWTGGAMSWSSTQFGSQDFNTYDSVRFTTNDASVTITGDVTASEVTIAEGVTVSLDGGDYQLTSTKGIDVQGTLQLNNDVLADGTDITGGNNGRLVINGEMDLGSDLKNFASTVEITADGSLNISAAHTSAAFVVDGTFTVGGQDASFLSKVTGSGTVVLSESTTVNGSLSSTFDGVIVVAADRTFFLGKSEAHIHQLNNATIKLNGGTLEVQGQSSYLDSLDVASTGTLKFEDGVSDVNLLTIGEVKIAGSQILKVQNHWEGIFNISNLNADGKLEIDLDGKMSTVIAGISKSGEIENKRAAHTLTLGTSSTSVLNLGGNITNSGTLNIKGNLAGTSTISGGTINIKEGASVSGNITFGTTVNLEAALTNTGTLTFSEAVDLSNGITNTGTLNFSKGYSSVGTLTNEGIFNLTGNVTIADIGKLEDSGQVTFSHNDGKDGYITGATYFVVESTGERAYATVTGDSKLMLGSAEIGSITSSGNNLVVDIHNENANSGIYYINTQDLTVDGTETNVAVNATGYVIAKDRTLTLRKDQNTTTMTASKILAEATGEGNITVDVDFTYQGQSKATGTLTINQGKTLKVGEGSNDTSNISSFNAVVLKGATLDLNGSAQEVQNLMVDTAKSTLSVRNQNKGHQIYTLFGTTTLKADLDVIPMDKEHGDLVVKNLTGIGNLHASGGNATWGPVVLKLEKLTDYTGTVSVDSLGRTSDINFVEFGKADTDAAFSTLKGLSLSNNAYATIHAKGDSTIENLTLTNGAKLNYTTNYSANTYTLSNVVVSGEGNSINLAATNTYYQGCLEIGNLTNARTEDGETIAGAITISGNAKTSARDVVNLNGGDFVGTITYKGATNDGTNRKHALNIKSATAAANAVINLEALSDGDVVALGIGADTVNVKGITGSKATIYSGEQEYGNSNDFASDTQKSRTLAINTAGVSYENSVAVAANVNLEKRGAGKQTFSGDMSAFNGSLKVIEGELAFTAAEALKVNGLYVGPEKNTAAPAASEGANVGILTVANGIEASGAVTLVGGAVINGNLDLNTATDVSFDVASGAITLNGALTMRSTEAFVTALDLTSLSAGDILTVFTGLASFTIGEVTSADFTSADLSIWSSSDAVAAGQYTVEYQVNNNVGSIVIINRMDAVPEPASATLSLAALMMLCARRRRK